MALADQGGAFTDVCSPASEIMVLRGTCRFAMTPSYSPYFAEPFVVVRDS